MKYLRAFLENFWTGLAHGCGITLVVLVTLLIVGMLRAHAATKPVELICIYGQGGPTFSLGFSAHCDDMGREFRMHVTKWWPRRPDLVVNYIRRLPARIRIAMLTYSLGVNSAASWVLPAIPKRKIELLVGYDGTVNAQMRAITRQVKRAIAFWQVCYFPTSIVFGRAHFTGPTVVTYKVCADHLAVQALPSLHRITEKALSRIR